MRDEHTEGFSYSENITGLSAEHVNIRFALTINSCTSVEHDSTWQIDHYITVHRVYVEI